MTSSLPSKRPSRSRWSPGRISIGSMVSNYQGSFAALKVKAIELGTPYLH